MSRAQLERLLASVFRRIHLLEWLVLGSVWGLFLPDVKLTITWMAACVLVANLAYREVCTAAAHYCDEVDTVVAANRHRLYTAVGFTPPTSTADERRRGRELCGYLDRRDPPPNQELGWPADGGLSGSGAAG